MDTVTVMDADDLHTFFFLRHNLQRYIKLSLGFLALSRLSIKRLRHLSFELVLASSTFTHVDTD